MKTKILLVGVSLLALTALLTLPACVTRSVVTVGANGNSVTNTFKDIDTNRVDSVAHQAAIDGTAYVLNAHPEWRPQFQQAEDDLNLLVASPSINLDDILAIVQKLPVKELKGSTAQMSFEGAQLAISLVGLPALPAAANADAQAIASAIASGIATGIANAPPVPVTAPAPVVTAPATN